MIKFFLILLLIVNSTIVLSQDLTFDETIGYLNDKLEAEFILPTRIKAFENGKFVIEGSSSPQFNYVYTWNFRLQDTEIIKVSKSKPKEVGQWNVFIKCLNDDCITFMNQDGSGREIHDGVSLYFNDLENAKKFEKALRFLESKVRNYKDPFGN